MSALTALLLTGPLLAGPWLAGPWLVAPSWASSAVADAGPWGWPLAGAPVLGRDFAPPASRYGSGHRGVDLVGVPGGAVRAAGAGRVSYAGMLAGRGVVVVVHGDLRTTYEPVSPVVAVGDTVRAGEQVGVLEARHAGCPATACLHWGLRRGEAYLDPVGLVERRPARLLPLAADPAAASRPMRALSAAGSTQLGDGRVGVPTGVGPPAGTIPWETATTVPSDPVDRDVEPAVVDLEPVRLTGTGQTGVSLGLLAAAALIAGIALLRGRRPEPSGPAAATAPPHALPAPGAPDDAGAVAQAPVLELATERLRRQSAS